MGTLFVVATPIGNMEDITLRAIRVLKEVKLIAAEDTRRTKKILNHYGIDTPMVSYHEHNEKEVAARLVEKLKGGSDVALVSDAGTPGISDPGYRLVKLAIENSVPVVPVPGASAFTAVLSVSGLPTDEFTFKGFIPAQSGKRKRFLSDMKARGGTFVMYEAPSRIKKTLSEMREILGEARIVVAREVTKLYEEILRGAIPDMERAFSEKEPLGEITLVVRSEKEGMPAGEVLGEVKRLLDAGVPWKDAVKAAALESGLPKSHVYKEALKLKRTGFPLKTPRE